MGGNSSKEDTSDKEKPVFEKIPIKGLKSGDVVTLKGELVYAHSKTFIVNFVSGDDIAFHFKIIILEAENHFNKVKMNSLIGGKWGAEVLKENVIYLNHFFELKFKCLNDKFVVEVDGNHLADLEHRVSPEKITSFETEGSNPSVEVEVPNRVNPLQAVNGSIYSLSANVDDTHIPTSEEIVLFVQSLSEDIPTLQAGTQQEEFEKLSQLMTNGLEITKSILEDKKGSFLKDVARYKGYLSQAFSGGQAVYAVIKFIMEYGQPSDTEKILNKLDEIKDQLNNIERAIEKGFTEVIEHMDFMQFRQEVKIPLRTMYNLYIRCYTVNGKQPVEEFKSYCTGKNSPWAVFSAMIEFLESRNNIFETHLKSKEYAYSVYDEWSTAIYNYATKLVTMNMFLLGIRAEEYKADGNNDLFINEEREAAQMIEHLVRMDARLKEIEAERMKTFHTGGFAKKRLCETFNEVKFRRSDYSKQLPGEILADIAYQMKQKWKNINGPEDFYIMVVRGRNDDEGGSRRQRRCVGWHIADPEKVSVAENVGQLSTIKSDGVCIALIQPLTKEIKEATEQFYKDKKETVKEIVESVKEFKYTFPSKTLPGIKQRIGKMAPFKPLLIMYNTDFGILPEAQWTRYSTYPVEIQPINYPMISETWSSAGGPFPLKTSWMNIDLDNYLDLLDARIRRTVQIVFQ